MVDIEYPIPKLHATTVGGLGGHSRPARSSDREILDLRARQWHADENLQDGRADGIENPIDKRLAIAWISKMRQ